MQLSAFFWVGRPSGGGIWLSQRRPMSRPARPYQPVSVLARRHAPQTQVGSAELIDMAGLGVTATGRARADKLIFGGGSMRFPMSPINHTRTPSPPLFRPPRLREHHPHTGRTRTRTSTRTRTCLALPRQRNTRPALWQESLFLASSTQSPNSASHQGDWTLFSPSLLAQLPACLSPARLCLCLV